MKVSLVTKQDYELYGFAKGADGSLRPFHLVILKPVRHPEFGWECRVRCQVLRDRPMRAFGDSPTFARSMAFALIRRLLEYAQLSVVDEAGRTVSLAEEAER